MRITIFTAGSRGDIQPCAILGSALQRAGLHPLLAAPENFADLIQGYNLPFYPLRGDIQQIMAGETGREFMQKGNANPLSQIRAMQTMVNSVASKMTEDAYEACRQAEALVSLAIFAPYAKTIAEAHRIPLILVEPTPLLPTRAFPAPGWMVQRNLGGLHNRLSGFAMLQVIWQWYHPSVNQFRRRLGLSPLRGVSFYQILKTTPLLGAYSQAIIPHPPDWSERVHITGYWFPESDHNWQPSPELEAFLQAGKPPVYVGFGSMGGRKPDELARLVLEALEISGQRGLLLTGWGGLQLEEVPKSVFVVQSAPHQWLFPRMAAVVHHGGAGTTAEGLRAGVPSVIVPFAFDQAFWGARLHALGLAPEPIPQKKLTADRLAHAIRLAVTQPGMRQRAQTCGETLRREDGVGNAVKIIQHYLERAGNKEQKT